MRILLLLTLLFWQAVSAQEDPPVDLLERFSDRDGHFPEELYSASLDSLLRLEARIEIEKARETLSSNDLWHRLIPSFELSASIGMHDLAFQQSASTVILPRDSYRLNAGLSISGLLNGSAHAQAEIDLARAETRYALVAERLRQARASLVRKLFALVREREFETQHLRILDSLGAYQEILFRQGKSEFRLLARSRIEAMHERLTLDRLEANIRAAEAALRRDGPP